MKRILLAGSLLVAVVGLAACGGDTSDTPTPGQSATTPAPVTPAATTPTPDDEPAPPTEMVIAANAEMMGVVDSWGGTITAWTSASDPIADLGGLTASNVGFWNNSYLGFGLFTEVSDLFIAFGEPRDDGLYGCPFVDEAFTGGCGDIRIYFADDSVTSVANGIPVVFESE